jgi:hypothetical protein
MYIHPSALILTDLNFWLQVSKRMMDKKYKDRITEAVQRLEQNGGKVSDTIL